LVKQLSVEVRGRGRALKRERERKKEGANMQALAPLWKLSAVARQTGAAALLPLCRDLSLKSWRPASASLGSSSSTSSSSQQLQQTRSIQFDIEDNSQVEFAMKKMNRKLNMEGILLEARIRERHTKKSDQKIIDQRSTAKRLARKAMGRRVRWIMKKRERGY
jgi:ribosomal protein S21